MNTKIKTQVLILGSGPGGYSAAFRCADLGMDTAIIERYPNLGGVCLNVGCIPSKALLHIAKLIKDNTHLNKYGINTKSENFHVDINKVRLWKNDMINRLSNHLTSMAKTRKINIINGSGKFINDHTVVVLNNQTTMEVIFSQAIIATGSQPIPLLFAPKDPRIWNSTDALSLQKIPNQLLIIGTGAIGLEMATIYSALGSKIDLVETYSQVMPILDENITKIFTKNFSKNKDLNFIINTQINSMHAKSDGIHVVMQDKTKLSITQYTNRYDAVLIAIGRSPNTQSLNLNDIGVNTDQYNHVIVDKQMHTSIPHIFAIGDITGHPMLAHKSIYEGKIAAEVICGKKYFSDAKVIPSVIYSDPEIAWVGYTEKEAKSKNLNYESLTLPWTTLGKAIASDCTVGITKLIFDKNTHRIVGGLVLGSNASEIIGEIALAIEMGCDAEDIALTIHAHPTLYESINLTASKYVESLMDPD